MYKKQFIQIITVFLFSYFTSNSTEYSGDLAERTPYSIALAKLSLMNDNTAIRIMKNNDDDYAVIGLLDDQFIKNDKDKKETTTFREYSSRAHYLSDFEARYLIIVCRSLIETLEEFERHIQQKKWGQCLYLDAFLPRFLRNFYILLGITRNNATKYADKICLFEEKYDVSLNSLRSDERIAAWKNDNDCQMKLRIAIKEVVHELHQWEKRELSNNNRNPEVFLSGKVEESLELFILIYFNIQNPEGCLPEVKKRF